MEKENGRTDKGRMEKGKKVKGEMQNNPSKLYVYINQQPYNGFISLQRSYPNKSQCFPFIATQHFLAKPVIPRCHSDKERGGIPRKFLIPFYRRVNAKRNAEKNRYKNTNRSLFLRRRDDTPYKQLVMELCHWQSPAKKLATM